MKKPDSIHIESGESKITKIDSKFPNSNSNEK